ncbi:MAG: NAD(P)H-hydrate dehydratase [Duncaniella sp.]|uniref:NAD(P)H-hydrate dehydratase n=1 Tax=Duncaniella sp. TaxID=2518496 RepID=UPI00199DC3C4|nr:NAD(P)H-hydrate dehydratase [Duncaniella sp.]MBD5313488.1 NAD(P)H-hydrate dehydratase [Bacteroides sp.]MBD5334030.1 NAD(P)H-hydrate dehydratase [Bacteroides sp.]MDE6090536.1 NAD(P)H-hydrate dehydratase [Duncaniella sp.]
MKIFTTENIRQIDRVTIEEEGVSSIELIHRVAEGVVSEILSRWSPSKPTMVFAGSGNNGADALIVAKLLIEAGFNPHVVLINVQGNSLSRDCRECRDELLRMGNVSITEIVRTSNIPPLTPDHLVIDGLFGSGLRNPLEGGYMGMARYINESGATVVSIDVPSGMFGDWNTRVLARNVVHADLTIAVQFPRLAFFLSDNAPLTGEWKTIDIGLSRRAIEQIPTKYFLIERDDVRRVLKARTDFCSKADFGHGLLFAGCYGMMGAAVLAARGALRAGVGKLTVHAPRCGFGVLQTAVPEALFLPDANENVISNMTPRVNFTAIGVGPGIGTNDATRGAVETLIKSIKRPMVLDADALNIIARTPSLIDHIAPGSILTPHAGEFDRIFGSQASAETRLLKALEVAHKYKLIIVLKGHYSATVRPDGKVFFNSTGSPAMATAGSGDVLTGIITSLLAQGYKSEIAATAGVYIHGLAGDIAAETEGDYGTSAADIAAAVGKAIKAIIGK